MKLPQTRDQLRERWERGERFEFFLFYGHKPPTSGVDASCLSQWFARPFEADGQSFATAEHWMMAGKAKLFGDEQACQKILESDDPRQAKALGRQVQSFDPAVWDEHKFDLVVQGNLAKFSQHHDLKRFLLSTATSRTPFRAVAESPAPYERTSSDQNVEGDSPAANVLPFPGASSKSESAPPVILVEAAGRDVIWGIGLGKNNPKALDPFTWRGRNLLGFALTLVRQRLADQADS